MVSRIQPMLMDVRVDYGIGLDIHGIAATIRLDAQGEIRVRIDVPVQPTKDPDASVSVPEGGIPCWHDQYTVVMQEDSTGHVMTK